MSQSVLFVTVGTTKFDALIRAVDDAAFADELAAQKFTRLVVQARPDARFEQGSATLEAEA